MNTTWSATQARRLRELNARPFDLEMTFNSKADREQAYQTIERDLVRSQRQQLLDFRDSVKCPALCRLENRLADVMIENEFSQVTTPIIMSAGLLKKMSIDHHHPLSSQIHWLDRSRCLRPMLAPHLYYILVDLLRHWHRPVRIFEIGPCFRKESQGAQHMEEFTMLNLVEMGLPVEKREDRIKELAAEVVKAAGIKDHHYKMVQSEVYGDTIDVIAGDPKVELASSAMGPHFLDRPWKIHETWIGIGFGLERLLMVANDDNHLGRHGRSLAYLDGARLNI